MPNVIGQNFERSGLVRFLELFFENFMFPYGTASSDQRQRYGEYYQKKEMGRLLNRHTGYSGDNEKIGD